MRIVRRLLFSAYNSHANRWCWWSSGVCGRLLVAVVSGQAVGRCWLLSADATPAGSCAAHLATHWAHLPTALPRCAATDRRHGDSPHLRRSSAQSSSHPIGVSTHPAPLCLHKNAHIAVLGHRRVEVFLHAVESRTIMRPSGSRHSISTLITCPELRRSGNSTCSCGSANPSSRIAARAIDSPRSRSSDCRNAAVCAAPA